MQTKMSHKALQFGRIRSSCIGYLNPLSASVHSYRNQSIDLLCKWHFHTIFTLLCGALKSFMKAFKAFIKPFEAPQRNVKIKNSLNFFSSSRIGTWKVKVILFLFFSFWIQFVFNYKIFFENLKLRVKYLIHGAMLKKITIPSLTCKKSYFRPVGYKAEMACWIWSTYKFNLVLSQWFWWSRAGEN